jgi:outer membrane protein insertion porin family
MNSTFGAKGTARRLAFLAAMLGLLSTGMSANAAPPQDPPRARAAGSRLGTHGLDLTDDRPKPTETSSAADLVDEPIADVLVEGNKTIPTLAITHYIRSQRGRRVSPQQIKEDTAALLNTNWFFRVSTTFRATEEGPVLVFQVVEKPILRSVEFIGNKKIKSDVLTGITGLRPNHGYDVAANKEAAVRIRQHYREKGYYFAEVKLAKGDHPDDRDVVFEIDEGKKVRVQRIRFDGNDFVSGPVLKTKLATKTAMLWILGGSYDPETIHNDADALTRYYHALGFFDAHVEPIEEFSPDKSDVFVTFRVNEGQRFKVRSINVVGNEVIKTEDLLKEPELGEGEYFNERFLRKDVEAMREQYDNLGRLFAEVEPVPRFLEEPGWVDLEYHINEDRPYRIGAINVHIQGDHPHSKEEVVRNQVNPFLKPGDLAQMENIQKAKVRVSGSVYWDRAVPPQFDVRPVDGRDYLPPTLVARGQNNIDAVFGTQTQVSPRFGRSAPPGSGATRGPAAPGRVRIDELEPGPDPFSGASNYNIDPDTVFRGQEPDEFVLRGQSIDRNGLPAPYDPLQTAPNDGDPFGNALRNPATPGFVDVNIDVTEARTGRLMFGVGVNSNAGLVGSIVLQEDNFNILRPPMSWSDIMNGHAFRGAGQSFRLELVPGTQVSRYMVSWQDPYFMNTDFSLGLSGFYYNRYYDDWTETREGGRISIGRLLSRYWSAGVAVRLESVDMGSFPAAAPQILKSAAGRSFLSTVQGTLTYDTRDSAFLPTQGHFLEAAYEQGFGEYTYPRVELTGSQFFTVWQRPDGFGKHILQFRGQAGWSGDETPIFERFFAGGYSSFRGFAFRGVSPRENGIGIGGQFMLLGTAEYMIPITADDNIRAVVFSDFGSVEEDVTLDDFRVTAGFGFRLAIPAMGPAPIALDFGFPILSEAFDDERIFSFYVGFTR